MKRLLSVLMCVLVGSLVLGTAAWSAEEPVAAPKKRKIFNLADQQHSLSIDVIRIADEAQFEGLMNLYYQCSIDKTSAVVIGLSHGHDVTLVEAAYKYYIGKYFQGPFAQVGLVVGDYDGDTEGGVTGALGYEHSLTRHLVAVGAVEMTVGSMDHPVTGDQDPIFRSILGLTFAF
ncbi:hypothetical protein JCM14469_15720 [Desulfatiferula olefinivorans]